MTICYSFLFSLMITLSITHWIHSASLGTSLLSRRYQMLSIPIEESTVEPILSRRRPFLPMSDRLRRGAAAAADDEDEVEISYHDKATEVSMETSTENLVVTEDFETASNLSVLENNVTIINQTESMVTSLTTVQDEENTTATVTENIIFNTTVESNVEPIVFNSTVQSISTDVTENQTLDNNITLFDHPSLTTVTVQNEETVSNNITVAMDDDVSTVTVGATEDAAMNNITSSIEEVSTIALKTTMEELSTIALTTTVEELSTIELVTMNETVVNSTTEELSTNETSVENVTIVEEFSTGFVDLTTSIIDLFTENGTELESNETESVDTISPSVIVTTPAIVLCDLPCQCAKKCPYGFEIVDDQCKCDPLCKNYNCFGNDTCVIKDGEKPVCEPPNNSTVHDRPKRCYQPRDPGFHADIIQYHSRWYYHPDQDECHLFVYRGLGGNENNFVSLNDCRLDCITCAPAPDRGPCLGYMKMWYYDHKTSRCSTFEYSGCKGNDNKFLREQECKDTCVSRILNL